MSSNRLLTIRAGDQSRRYIQDLVEYRELFLVLAWRDVAVRYKQTVIGILWAVIRPVLTMAVFTVLFGRLADLPSDGSAPYIVLVFAGTVPWFLFATALAEGSQTLVTNANLVRKIYFPRLMAPFAATVVSLVDFLIAMVILFILMVAVGFWPDWRIIVLPFAIIFAMAAALGPVMLLSALSVRYRDFRIVVPFVVQFGLYVSPVGFSSAVVPDHLQLIYHLNPMAGVIDVFRYALLAGESTLDPASILASLAVTAFLFWLGLRVFRKTESTFADLV